MGGVGAALGAAAAWRAASASSQAAERANAALAMNIRPEVSAVVSKWDGETIAGRAYVRGRVNEWPASNMVLQFTCSDGRSGSTDAPQLQPNFDPHPYPFTEPYLQVKIGTPDEKWPPPGGDRVEILVTFNDFRHIASYQLTTAVEVRRSGEEVTVHLVEQEQTTQVTPQGIVSSVAI